MNGQLKPQIMPREEPNIRPNYSKFRDQLQLQEDQADQECAVCKLLSFAL